MTNKERIQTNNNELLECIEIAENLPDISEGTNEDIIKSLIGLIEGSLNGRVIVPNGTTKLRTGIFSGFYLTSIEIPNSVTTIDSSVFYSCPNLESITIPSSVVSIGRQAFLTGSTTKTAFIFEGTTPPTIYGNTFSADYLESIKVPMSAVNTYKNATNWANFADYILGYEV